jgi:hypothetical protein
MAEGPGRAKSGSRLLRKRSASEADIGQDSDAVSPRIAKECQGRRLQIVTILNAQRRTYHFLTVRTMERLPILGGRVDQLASFLKKLFDCTGWCVGNR